MSGRRSSTAKYISGIEGWEIPLCGAVPKSVRYLAESTEVMVPAVTPVPVVPEPPDPEPTSRPWTFSDSTSTLMFLDASDASTLTLEGDEVVEWRDKINGVAYTPLAGFPRPTYDPVAKVVIMNGSPLWTASRFGLAADPEVSFVTLVQPTTSGNSGRLFALGGDKDERMTSNLQMSITTSDCSWRHDDGYARYDTGETPDQTITTFHRLPGNYSTGKVRQNGAELPQHSSNSGGPPTRTRNESTIGRTPWAGRISVLVLANTSDLEYLQKADGYLKSTNPAVAALPTDHPYATEPPTVDITPPTDTAAPSVGTLTTNYELNPDTLPPAIGPITENYVLNPDVTAPTVGSLTTDYVINPDTDAPSIGNINSDFTPASDRVAPQIGPANSNYVLNPDTTVPTVGDPITDYALNPDTDAPSITDISSDFTPVSGSTAPQVGAIATDYTLNPDTVPPGIGSVSQDYGLNSVDSDTPVISGISSDFTPAPDRNSPEIGAIEDNYVEIIQPFSQIYEAEDATLFGVDIMTRPDSSSGSYADFSSTSGAYIEWDVDVPGGGEYDLTWRYWFGNINRPLRLTINGTTIGGNLNFPSTPDWDTSADYVQRHTLTAGNNKIRLTETGQSGCNFDYLKLDRIT